MNFNRINLQLIFVLLVPIFGCGLKYGEKVKPTDVVEFKNGSCLTNSNKITKSFFNGQAEASKVGEAVDCYANVIETFRDNVRGAEADAFSPEEIQIFLKYNFMKDSEFDLSVPLVEELLKLKVVIAGGTRFRITHDELGHLANAFREIKPDVVALTPVMPLVVGLDSIDTHTILTENPRLQSEFSAQGKIFTQALLKMSRIFKHGHLNYRVDELYQLIFQILKSNHSEPATLEKFELLKSLVIKVSEVVIDDGLILDEQSWPRLLNALGDGYMAYRRYDLLVKDETKETGFDKLTLQKIINDVHPMLGTLISQKTTGSISNIEIYQLLDSAKILFSKNFLDKPDLTKWVQKILDLQTYKQLMNLLWSHVLNDPGQRIQGRPTNAFDVTALNTVAFELGYLFRSQSDVHRMFETFKARGVEANRFEIKAFLQSIISGEQTWAEDLDRLYASEQIQMFSSPAIMTFDENNYLKILDLSNRSPQTAYTINDFEKSNYSRAGSRLLIRAFSTELNAAQLVTKISKADTFFGWNLARPIVVELNFVQPDNLTFISSRFREADLFISSSNGDDILQFAETHDIILHIYSGKKRSDTLRKDIVYKCLPGTDPESYKPKDSMNEVCLIDFYTTATNGFQSMPKYQEMITRVPAEMPNHAMSLLKAAGHEVNPEHLVKFENLDLYPHVVQYIEMLFNKFDSDQNGILDKFEALNAYSTFEKTIEELAGAIEPESRKGMFLYLVDRGRLYKKEEYKEFTKFINDRRDLQTTDRWAISATRLSVGRLFNFLADNFNKKQKK